VTIDGPPGGPLRPPSLRSGEASQSDSAASAASRWRCYRCGMSFLLECPLPRKRGLVCSDCGIIFGATSFDGKKPIICWLIRLNDDLPAGVRKIA
jgi:hypothetical protein